MPKKPGKGRAAKNARRAAAGIPVAPAKRRKSKLLEKRLEKREYEKVAKHEGAIAQAEADLTVQEQALAKQPHSFIVHTGSVGRYIRRLERDLRRVMEPNTASKLRVSKRNNFNDFVVNAPALGVSHIANFTKSENSVNFRIVRMPQGPTLSFQIDQYALARDVRASQKRQNIFQKLFKHSPLVVLNGFNVPGKKHLALVKTVLQNMFPSIDVDTVNLAVVRRAVLISYDNETDKIEFRHYSIKTVPAGLTKSAKKIVQGKVPDLSKYEDVSEYFLNPGVLSESEWDGDQAEVELTQDLATRGCKKGALTKLRTVELGPRMTWRLTKIQEGIDDGEVLYHSYIKKTPQELMEQRKMLPLLKKRKKRMQKNIEHAVIRKLTAAEEAQKQEEEEYKAMKEKLIQKQKSVTGDNDDSDKETKKAQQYEQKGQKDQGPEPPTMKAEGRKRTAGKDDSRGIKNKVLRKK
uniref:Brix domain-containing protein n=1 Tax=Panagrolaimus davidi TaxID=227884 RepID=A0A914QW12_9BILA